MGRATITSESGEGLYTIKVDQDWTLADKMLARHAQALETIDEKITEEQAKTDPDQGAIGILELKRVAIEKQVAKINAIKTAGDQEVQAWCADYSEGLTGSVGTIEPGTDAKNGILIRPAYGGAGHDRNRDGIAFPFALLPTADAILNFALMPAIQKWRPTWRVGTASNIDTDLDTCTVTLDPLASRILDLDINQASVLHDVPVDYMSCHADVFEEGDRVVIAFDGHDWNAPRVIGFESYPAPCGWEEPWDGPSVVSKYPWTYAHSVLDADPPGSTNLATLSIVDGHLVIEVPDTGTTEYFEQQHIIAYIPDPGPVYGRTRQVRFNAAGMIDCTNEDARYHAWYLVVRGYTETGDVMIVDLIVITNLEFFVERVGYMGCTENNYAESDWYSETGTIPTTDTFEEDWGKDYVRYMKTVRNDRAVWFMLPETMDFVKAVSVNMLITMAGGLDPQPGTMPAATLTVDLIGLS